jgi:hypothetical protein
MREMAVRKSLEERVVVKGERSELLERCRTALQRGGFSKIDVNSVLFQVDARYRKFTTSGTLLLSLLPVPEGVEISMRSTANADNIYAIFRSPNQKILRAFKDNLS